MFSARIALLAVPLLGMAFLIQQPEQLKAVAKPTREQIARWVEQLGDDDFHVRETAMDKLGQAGEEAETALKVAASSEDAEVAHRAGELLEQIQQIKERKDVLSIFQLVKQDQALVKAKCEKKVVMIDFYADWCGWCKVLEDKTFSDEAVKKFLTDKTIPIKINAEEKPNGEKLAKEYKVTGYPCIVFVDGDGKEVGRVIGYKPPQAFLEEVNTFVK